MDREVAVIGAGLSGLCAAIKLGRAGLEDHIILERAGDVGGCWRDNTYPGISVDTSTFSYALSFAKNPGWSRTFAPGWEVHRYARGLADEPGVRERIRLHWRLARAEFDDDRHYWRLESEDGETLTARFVIDATGIIRDPKLPDIDGIASFAGKTIHTARWDHGHDLTGERVAVIGTGASGIQVIPQIAPIADRLHVFQRTPIWVLPKSDYPIPAVVRWAFGAIPATQATVRLVNDTALEAAAYGFRHYRQIPFVVRAAEAYGRWFLRSQVRDPELRAKLTPSYTLLCKRPGLANDYFPAFNRDNVELVTDPIERIVAAGIETADGAVRELDTLVLATGYSVLEPGNWPGFELISGDGHGLSEHWHEHRFESYEGVSVAGFPNFFMVTGPYSLPSLSFLATSEANTDHAIRAIMATRRRGATSVQVRSEAVDAYVASMRGRQADSVLYAGDCTGANSYYFDHRGDAPLHRATAAVQMARRSRSYDLDDYVYSRVAALPPLGNAGHSARRGSS